MCGLLLFLLLLFTIGNDDDDGDSEMKRVGNDVICLWYSLKFCLDGEAAFLILINATFF